MCLLLSCLVYCIVLRCVTYVQQSLHLLHCVVLCELSLAVLLGLFPVVLCLLYCIRFGNRGTVLAEFLATDTEVPGSIPGATRFSE